MDLKETKVFFSPSLPFVRSLGAPMGPFSYEVGGGGHDLKDASHRNHKLHRTTASS